MDRPSLLTALALVGIATVAGGAIVRVTALSQSPAALATLGVVSVVVVAGVVLGVRRRPRGNTPYWG